MFSLDNWIRALFVGYYLTGVNMVLYHSASAPGDRPGYVYLGFWRRLISGALWPYVARRNRELGWFVVTYFASVVVAAGFYWVVGFVLDYGFWRTLLVIVLCATPLGAMPLALVSAFLWLMLRRPLGLQVPAAMERTQSRHESGAALAEMPDSSTPAPIAARRNPFTVANKSYPPEVASLLERIGSFRDGLPPDVRFTADPILASLHQTVAFEWLEADINNYVRIAREGHSAESFICNHLVHTTANELESGQHHVYRGVLGMVGSQYRALFEYAIRTMVARGEYTDAWATEHLRSAVYDSVKRVG